MDAPSSGPETIAEFYARVEAALGPDRRLPVAVEEMPGWDIFPFEIDSLRIKPLAPLADSEPDRRGENEDESWCAGPFEPKSDHRLVWWNENWKLSTDLFGSGLPIMLWLSPMTHCDLPTMPPEVAAGVGPLMTTISAAIEDLPSVGRVQLAKYGDGWRAPAPAVHGPSVPDAAAAWLAHARLGGEPSAGPRRRRPAQLPSDRRGVDIDLRWPDRSGGRLNLQFPEPDSEFERSTQN